VSEQTLGALPILIVHFNTPELTNALLRDLPARSPLGREIFVHVRDNSSTRPNLEKLQECITALPNVTLSTGPNIGYGEALNSLVEEPTVKDTDIIWILNPDTRVGTDCIEALEVELASNRYDVVSPLIYSGEPNNSWIWYCGGSWDTRSLRVTHRHYGLPVSESPIDPFETEFMTGAAPMMSVATFRTVGGFPLGYFLYWEDVHFSWRARLLGFRLGVVPSAQLWHAVGAASGSGQSTTYYYWSARNRFVFAREVGVSRWQLVLGRGSATSLRPLARAMLKERNRRLAKTGAAIRGTIAGFRCTEGK